MSVIRAELGLNEISKKMKAYGDFVNTYIIAFKACTEELPSYWVGDDASAFKKKIEEITPCLEKYRDDLYTFADYLSKIYMIFNTIEQSYNRSINV